MRPQSAAGPKLVLTGWWVGVKKQQGTRVTMQASKILPRSFIRVRLDERERKMAQILRSWAKKQVSPKLSGLESRRNNIFSFASITTDLQSQEDLLERNSL